MRMWEIQYANGRIRIVFADSMAEIVSNWPDAVWINEVIIK